MPRTRKVIESAQSKRTKNPVTIYYCLPKEDREKIVAILDERGLQNKHIKDYLGVSESDLSRIFNAQRPCDSSFLINLYHLMYHRDAEFLAGYINLDPFHPAFVPRLKSAGAIFTDEISRKFNDRTIEITRDFEILDNARKKSTLFTCEKVVLDVKEFYEPCKFEIDFFTGFKVDSRHLEYHLGEIGDVFKDQTRIKQDRILDRLESFHHTFKRRKG